MQVFIQREAVLLLKEDELGFKGTEYFFKTKLSLLTEHRNFINFQAIEILFHLRCPTFFKYHFI